jgi:diguanylate cyclase (GGDEF)-like protein
VASTPIADARGRRLGRLHALIDFEGLAPLLTSPELGENARVLVIDRARRYLNPPEGIDPDTLYEGHASDDGDSPGHHTAVTYRDEARDIEVVETHSPFPRFGWTLVVEQPYAEAFAPVLSSMTRVIGLNVAIVLACGLVALRLAGSIVQPLRELSAAARRLSEGEREVVIDERDSSDEVGLLTRTFNEMSRALGRITHELEENHRAIESTNRELVVKNEELSEMNLVLEQLSITDGLTKLHNHRYFQDAMAQACKRSLRTREPLSLLLVDIDYFKRWNDRLGHAAGDEILRRMAETLNESVRETDLVARYGGEEFAVLAADTDLEGATALGEKIRQAVGETEFVTDVPSERERLTVSVGAACFEGDRRQLFSDADAALYRAKRAGRDCVVATEPGAVVEEADDACS